MCHQHVETSVLHWLPLRSTPCRAFALQQRRKSRKEKPSRFPSRTMTARRKASSAALKANCSPTKTPAATCPSRWIMATTDSLIPRGKHSSAKPTALSTNPIPAYASAGPARGRVCLRWRLSRRMGRFGLRVISRLPTVIIPVCRQSLQVHFLPWVLGARNAWRTGRIPLAQMPSTSQIALW